MVKEKLSSKKIYCLLLNLLFCPSRRAERPPKNFTPIIFTHKKFFIAIFSLNPKKKKEKGSKQTKGINE